MLYNLFTKHDKALIVEALGEPESHHPVLERKVLDEWIDTIAEDVEFSGVQQLTSLVNMGLLDNMASSAYSSEVRNRLKAAPERIVINDWAADEGAVAAHLKHPEKGNIAEKQIKVSDKVLLLTTRTTMFTFLMDNQLKYILETKTCQPWIDVLHKLDGTSLCKRYWKSCPFRKAVSG